MQSDRLSNVENLRQAAKACVVLSPLLGMTWAFGILSVTNAGLIFQYIFTILNSLQVTYELLLLVAFVTEVGIASIIINVRALTNLPFARTSLPHLLRKWNPSVLPNWERCAWPNCLSFQRRVSLVKNSSTDAFHLKTDPACQLWQMVNVFSFCVGSALAVRWTIRILKTQPAWLCGVLSSSIQFRRDIISILLTSFSRSVL